PRPGLTRRIVVQPALTGDDATHDRTLVSWRPDLDGEVVMDQHDGSPAGSTGAATPAAGGTHRAASPGVEGPLPGVTLWEHFGAGADAIGREVAERLALPYHQQAFSSEEIESDGRDRGPSAEQQAAQIESSLALAQVFSAMGGMYGGFDEIGR